MWDANGFETPPAAALTALNAPPWFPHSIFDGATYTDLPIGERSPDTKKFRPAGRSWLGGRTFEQDLIEIILSSGVGTPSLKMTFSSLNNLSPLSNISEKFWPARETKSAGKARPGGENVGKISRRKNCPAQWDLRSEIGYFPFEKDCHPLLEALSQHSCW